MYMDKRKLDKKKTDTYVLLKNKSAGVVPVLSLLVSSARGRFLKKD